MNRLIGLPLTAACLALAAPAMAAQGNAYPNKPIRLIVPFPPGGGTDLVSRIMQPALSADLGQQVLLDNRGGAQGTLGTAIAATANPDGYTLVISEIGATAVAPALMPKLGFDVARDFVGISQLIEQPYIMTVHPSVQAKTLAEFIKLAQSKPNSMNFGSGNVTAHELNALLLGLLEAGEMPLVPPGQHLRIQINANGASPRSATDPLAGDGAGPAEVFPQTLGRPAPDLAKGIHDVLTLRVGSLHRRLVGLV